MCRVRGKGSRGGGEAAVSAALSAAQAGRWRTKTLTSPPSPRGSWRRHHRCSSHRSWMVRAERARLSRRTRTARFLDTRNIFGCADVKSVVDDASIMDAVAPKARKAYNTDQMTSIDGPDGKVRLCV